MLVSFVTAPLDLARCVCIDDEVPRRPDYRHAILCQIDEHVIGSSRVTTAVVSEQDLAQPVHRALIRSKATLVAPRSHRRIFAWSSTIDTRATPNAQPRSGLSARY